MKKAILSLVLVIVMLSAMAIPAFAEDGATIYYFVDCGDYTVETVSEGDAFGIYNSVTDQFFGADPGTGYEWGVVDEARDTAAETFGDSRVCTTWTWPYEYNEVGVEVPKEESNRYCRNMYENGLDRIMTYKFQMPEDGEYVIEVGFSNPWSCASPVDMYINGELAESGILIDNVGYAYAYTTASPKDGYITLDLTTIINTINCTYIIISDKLTNEETEPWIEDTYVPNIDPPEEETTEEPVDNDTADTTAAPAETEAPEEGGCGSSMGMAALAVALVSTLGCAVIKKH